MTLACEDANSKLVEVVTVADVDTEDHVGNSLLQIWELTERELLTPSVKNFITKEWLVKSDSRLSRYVRETRGHLFTTE